MENINKNIIKNLLIIITYLAFITQTIAYSAIPTTMTIKGDSYAKIQSDIRHRSVPQSRGTERKS